MTETQPMPQAHDDPAKRRLIEQLDAAVTRPTDEARCDAVKAALQELVRSGTRLDEAFVAPVADGYARRLLHRDPDNRYSVVVMSWGPNQGTAIHDHAGLWCVECVYRGKILVKSYDLVERRDDESVRFEHQHDVVAEVGEAGSLIPPFEYHVIENPFDAPAATLHVYGGEMTTCCVFEPVEGSGLHQPQRRQLSYNG